MPNRAPSLTRHLERLGPIDPSAMPIREARAELRTFYRNNGAADRAELLTRPTSQPKLGKSIRPAYGLSLAPADMSGWDACIWRTPECTAACVLATGGRSKFAPIRAARVLKTRALAEHPQAFVTVLAHEIDAAARRHGGIDLRLNVASDLRWERIAPALLERPNVRAYDYTKAPASARTVDASYRLTFSVSERPQSVREALRWLESGGNAAVVFERMTRSDWDGILPNDWEGFEVIDGDVSDSRADDAPSTVVGLRAKGDAIGTAGAPDRFVKVGARG
jgi:hypothetical protein